MSAADKLRAQKSNAHHIVVLCAEHDDSESEAIAAFIEHAELLVGNGTGKVVGWRVYRGLAGTTLELFHPDATSIKRHGDTAAAAYAAMAGDLGWYT